MKNNSSNFIGGKSGGNFSIKQMAFIAIGMLIIVGVFFVARMQTVEAAKQDGKKFEDWTVVCQPKDAKAKGPRMCYLTQQVNVEPKQPKTEGAEKSSPSVFAFYQFVYSDVAENKADKKDSKKTKTEKKLNLVQILPHSITIPSGISIISGNAAVSNGYFTHCNAVGCHGLQHINEETLQKILSSKEKTFVVYIGADGKQVNVPLSTKGLRDGLKYIK